MTEEQKKGPPESVHARLVALAEAMSLACFGQDGAVLVDEETAAMAEAASACATAALAIENHNQQRAGIQMQIKQAALSCPHDIQITPGGAICSRCKLPHSIIKQIQDANKTATPAVEEPT